MYRAKKLAEMAQNITANIEMLEQELKEEYKKLIRISPEFNEIAAEFVMLERKPLAPEIKDYEATTIVDRLHSQLGLTFGVERENNVVIEAAMDVMDEFSVSAMTPN